MHAAHSTKQLSFIAQALRHDRELAECLLGQAQLQCDPWTNDFNSGLGRLIWQFDVLA